MISPENRDEDATYADVVNVLSEVLAMDTDDISPESRYYDDLGAESIDTLGLGFELERRFAIHLGKPADLAKQLHAHQSVQEIADYVHAVVQVKSQDSSNHQ